MRAPLIVATILFATAVSAYAQPQREATPVREESSSGRLRLDERRPARMRLVAPRRVNGWAELADATPTKFGTVFVMVGGERTGTFGTLRVDAVSGRVVIRRVRVYFTDSTDKTYAVSKTLDGKRHKSTLIDLGSAKAIDRIVITTVGTIRGEYMIYGSDAVAASNRACC
jgi:hypothetical protein